MEQATFKSAVVSDCGTYRYQLERRWGSAPPQVFIMLNPSTADAREDDPTIRRCMGFAMRERAGGIYVVNLFALRATNPKELRDHPDPVGPDNTRAIGLALIAAEATMMPPICAWGADDFAKTEAARLIRRVKDFHIKLTCLGKTMSGAPKHPLYLKGDTPVTPYP